MSESSRSIAILYDLSYPFVDGGGQRRLFEVGRYLAARGWTVHWYTLKMWEGDAVRTHDGIIYYGLSGYTHFYREDGKRSVREALSFGRAILRAPVKFSDYDVVWCAQWPLFHILALMVRLVPWRTELLVDWWEVWGQYWLEYAGWLGLGGWILEFVLTNCVTRLGHVVVDSSVGLERVGKLGVRRSALSLIPNGVDVSGLTAGEPAEGTSDIAYFGRLKGHKNIDHIVRAVAILKDRDGQRVKFDLIGNGPERERLAQLTRDLGVEDQIIFHGRVETERAKALLKHSKVFVHASTQECGGTVNLLEAYACGLPVVCYRHPMGIDQTAVSQGETGLMVSPVEPASLAQGISEMLRLVEVKDMRTQCVAFVRSFDWSEIGRRYFALIESLLGQRNTAPEREAAGTDEPAETLRRSSESLTSP